MRFKTTGFFVRRISGDRHLADVLTKPKSVCDMEDKINALGGHIVPDIDDSDEVCGGCRNVDSQMCPLLARAMWKYPIP